MFASARTLKDSREEVLGLANREWRRMGWIRVGGRRLTGEWGLGRMG